MNFTYGNKEGRYFTQWRFDDLENLAGEIAYIFRVDDFHLWYDATKDFHLMSFDCFGHKMTIRYYKVCNVIVGGENSTDFPVPIHCVIRVLIKQKEIFKWQIAN